ncbi:ATP-binding protein [Nonlabens sp. SY33080]|uniref:ATP-binding protein n=1 Tax=Nonlabens sp. SY33080 TaxID=2719911 RepID=UPI00142895F0|nr:ATP-binding protein [Nonlabens sp. SY33080]
MFAFGQVSNSETNQGLNTASRVLLERVEGLIDSRDFDEAKSLIIDSRTLINDDYGDRLLDLYFIELELESSSGENPTSPFVQFKDEELSQDAFIYLEYLKGRKAFLKKEFSKADSVFTSTFSITKKLGDTHRLFLKSELYTAQLNFFEKNYTVTTAVLNDLIPRLEEKGLEYEQTQAYLTLGEIAHSKNNYEEANIYYSLAQILIKENQFPLLEIKLYKLFAQHYRDLQDYQNSLVYLEKHVQTIEDNGFIGGENAKQLSSLNSEIESLKGIITQKDKELENKENYYIILCMFITLLTITSLALFRRNILKAKRNSRLAHEKSALINERNKAQDAAQIKADFLSTITHELRTPMYAVTGLTHLLLSSSPRDDQQEHLETLKSSGEYLLSLIDNILDFNKLEANKVELEEIKFDLRKRIADIVKTLDKQVKDKNNKIVIIHDEAIASSLVGDPVKISQILINLLGNSIKFTSNGTITIKTKLIKKSKEKSKILFEVQDTGKGISKDRQEQIFENFTQENIETAREHGGTGLGLAIVKKLVTLMGSEIKLESEVGKGSVFSFAIDFNNPDSNSFVDQLDSNNTKAPTPTPIAVYGSHDEVPTPAKTAPILKTETPEFEILKGKKVLIVEDNKINQMITKKILEQKEFICDVANNGEEAVAMARANEYDLILMDIHMPVMDGKRATVEIRKFNSKTPLLALTAVTLENAQDELIEIGFDDIIPKPFKMDEFFGKIQRAFSNIQII